jgi:colanic acid/amylovoran biosynthesis protein
MRQEGQVQTTSDHYRECEMKRDPTSLPLAGVQQVAGHASLRQTPKARVAVLGASFTTGNHGVAALASGTLAALRHSLDGVEVCLLDYGREPLLWIARASCGDRVIETINLRFSKQFWLPTHILRLLLTAGFLRLVPSARFRNRFISKNPSLRRIAECSAHLSIAAGDSFSDIYGMLRLLHVALPQILVLLLGKPLVLLPQTYGPFKSWPARCIARFILRRAKLVYSRDREGLKVVQDLLGKRVERMRFGYDMGFALEPLPPAPEVVRQIAEMKEKGDVVGLNVSGLLYMGGYTRDNMFGLASDYPRLVRTLLEEFTERKGVQVMLVPHVFGGPENPESDETACARIVEETAGRYAGRLHYLPGRFDQHEIKHLIGQCDFFVGSRMHACIAALSQGIPAVGLAYSRKFAGVIDSIGGGAAVVDLRQVSTTAAVEVINRAWEERGEFGRQLAERMPHVRESVLNFFAASEFRQLLTA